MRQSWKRSVVNPVMKSGLSKYVEIRIVSVIRYVKTALPGRSDRSRRCSLSSDSGAARGTLTARRPGSCAFPASARRMSRDFVKPVTSARLDNASNSKSVTLIVPVGVAAPTPREPGTPPIHGASGTAAEDILLPPGARRRPSRCTWTLPSRPLPGMQIR